MRNILPAALLLALSLAAAPALSAAGGIGIAATVNDDIITLSDVKSRMQLYLAGAPQPPADARRQMEQQILDKLIDEKLQMQEAAALGVTVAPEQISGAFAQIAGQNGLDADAFRKKLGGAGVRIETLQEQIRAELSWAQVVRRKLRPQINVSETEIDGMMERLSRERQKPQYQVAEIFLPVPAPAAESGARAEAEKIVSQITKGASFSSMARAFSQAPGAALGGDLGWVQDGQLEAVLDTALRGMKPGQISPPLRTEKGWHILFLRNLRMPEYTPAAAPGPAASGGGPVIHLRQIMIPTAPNDPAPVLNAKFVRARALKDEIKSCAQMEEKGKDFVSPATGDLGRGPLGALPAPIRAAVENLPVETLSDPLRGENGVSVFMVCAREDAPAQTGQNAAPPAFSLDRSDESAREDVANRIGMERLEQMQERYLRDLRATAFVEKRL